MQLWLKELFSAFSAIFSLPSESPSIRTSALIELERRGLMGAFVYLPCWLAVSTSTGVSTSNPDIHINLTLSLAAVLILRILFHYYCPRIMQRNETFGRILLCFLILTGGIIFGMTVLAAMYVTALAPVLHPMIVVCGVLCTVGSLMLSIDPLIRYGMPTVMLVPFMLGLAGKGNGADVTFSLLVLVNIIYLVLASRYVHADYWNGVHLRAQLEAQAALHEKLSLTDGLTGLHNRLHAERKLKEEWYQASRTQSPLSALLIDIDHFKTINDTYGHPFGDECLARVAKSLQAGASRESDFVSRFGGEEFLVLLPNTPLNYATMIAERIRELVENLRIQYGENSVSLSCSIGVATAILTHEEEASSMLVSQADKALYQAKQNGRNRVVCAESTGEFNTLS
ncbi:GGDEF domain-containing protein [Pseudomonas sp. LRF_L74]|uniref:GGDEF domain-containing protein n=1 Tax=Pseudomonas sp. LRF_L74 TaxID=3369422 RepID=UPI003F5E5705